MIDWKKIPLVANLDVAPFDGEPVLIWKGDERRVGDYMVVSHYCERVGGFVDSVGRKHGYLSDIGRPQGYPTHWSPLPPSPHETGIAPFWVPEELIWSEERESALEDIDTMSDEELSELLTEMARTELDVDIARYAGVELVDPAALPAVVIAKLLSDRGRGIAIGE